MKELNEFEINAVDGGMVKVSGETWGCAIGGAIGSYGGPWGGAAGCLAGAYVVNNWNGFFGPAFSSLNHANLTF